MDALFEEINELIDDIENRTNTFKGRQIILYTYLQSETAQRLRFKQLILFFYMLHHSCNNTHLHQQTQTKDE